MSDRPPFRVSIASPCSKDWAQMKGTAQKRFCDSCHKHVYDLSMMRYDEVKELLEREVPPCVRLWQRADGTVMTADCPVGRERARRELRRLFALAAAAAVGIAAFLRGWFGAPAPECEVSPLSPIEGLASQLPPPPDAPVDEGWIAERRSRLGGFESPRASRRMGLTIGVIRGNSGEAKK